MLNVARIYAKVSQRVESARCIPGQILKTGIRKRVIGIGVVGCE